MSTISYLPNVSPHNNNVQQPRRRINNLVAQVSQQVGAIATGTGDLGALNVQVGGIHSILSAGITGTVTLAKITGGGANGSLTFANGIITAVVQPT